MAVIPEAVDRYVRIFAATRSPDRILLFSKDRATTQALRNGFDGKTSVAVVDDDGLAHLAGAGSRVDLAIVIDGFAERPTAASRQLLSELRDRIAATVLVAVGPAPTGTYSWTLSDYIALGFRRSPDSRNIADGWSLYCYDIYDYKITPSWLNSRYWANPERW